MGHSKTNIAILILAAGSSSRMGTPKQILPWGDTTLLGNAIDNAKATGIVAIHVILGANAAQILEVTRTSGIHFLKNDQWEEGLGTSIATGIQHFKKEGKNYKGLLVMLCDQPLIDTNYLNQIITYFQQEEKSIIATSYGKRIGVPVLFDHIYFEELAGLHRDYGAKEILQTHKNEIMVLDAMGKAIDVDTMREYEKLKTDTFGHK